MPSLFFCAVSNLTGDHAITDKRRSDFNPCVRRAAKQLVCLPDRVEYFDPA